MANSRKRIDHKFRSAWPSLKLKYFCFEQFEHLVLRPSFLSVRALLPNTAVLEYSKADRIPIIRPALSFYPTFFRPCIFVAFCDSQDALHRCIGAAGVKKFRHVRDVRLAEGRERERRKRSKMTWRAEGGNTIL